MAVTVLSTTVCGVALGEVTLSTPESDPPSVYMTQNPDEIERYAAEELARVLGVMTDAGVDEVRYKM